MIKPTRKRVLKQIKNFRKMATGLDTPEGDLQYRGELLFDDDGELIASSSAIFMTDDEIADCIEVVCGGFKKK